MVKPLIKVSAKYSRKTDDGTAKKVTEKYIVSAYTIVDAEAKTIEHITPYMSDGDECTCTSAQIAPMIEAFNYEAEKLYVAKVRMTIFDDEKGSKEMIVQWLVGGSDFNDAYEEVLKQFKEIPMADPVLVGLTETSFIEYLI